MRWDAVGHLHWYSILRLAAQEVPYSPFAPHRDAKTNMQLPGSSPSLWARLAYDRQPPTNSPCLNLEVTAMCVRSVLHFLSLPRLDFFSASWNLVLKWNQSWLPACGCWKGVAWWFGLKCYQMRCGGVNPYIFTLLYSVLPLLVSVQLRRSEVK